MNEYNAPNTGDKVTFPKSMPLDEFYNTGVVKLQEHEEKTITVNEAKECNLHFAWEVETTDGEYLLIPKHPQFTSVN